jgi:hypothetical protein
MYMQSASTRAALTGFPTEHDMDQRLRIKQTALFFRNARTAGQRCQSPRSGTRWRVSQAHLIYVCFCTPNRLTRWPPVPKMGSGIRLRLSRIQHTKEIPEQSVASDPFVLGRGSKTGQANVHWSDAVGKAPIILHGVANQSAGATLVENRAWRMSQIRIFCCPRHGTTGWGSLALKILLQATESVALENQPRWFGQPIS